MESDIKLEDTNLHLLGDEINIEGRELNIKTGDLSLEKHRDRILSKLIIKGDITIDKKLKVLIPIPSQVVEQPSESGIRPGVTDKVDVDEFRVKPYTQNHQQFFDIEYERSPIDLGEVISDLLEKVATLEAKIASLTNG